MLNGALVDTPDTARFMSIVSTPSGRRGTLGDKTKFSGTPRTYNAMGRVDTALTSAIDKMKGLHNDKTRPMPLDKHLFGERQAEKVVGEVNAALNAFKGDMDAAGNEAVEILDRTFDLSRSERIFLDRNLDFINREAKEKGGIAKIRDAMKADIDVAKLIVKGKPHLLGLPAEVLNNLYNESVAHHAPRAMQLLDHINEIANVAKKHEAIIPMVERSFFSRTIIDAAISTRVEE